MINRFWNGDQMDESPGDHGYRAYVYENRCSLWGETLSAPRPRHQGPPDKRFAQAWVYLEDRQ